MPGTTFGGCRRPTRSRGARPTSYAEYLTSTSARADYYTAEGKLDPNLDVPSKWHGSQKVLKELGLSPDETVTTEDLVVGDERVQPGHGGAVEACRV